MKYLKEGGPVPQPLPEPLGIQRRAHRRGHRRKGGDRQRQRRRRQWLARFSLSLVVLTSAFVLWGWRAPESVLQAALALDAWRSGAEVHVSQVGDHQLAWLAMREQPDRPTLVLLHGFTGRKENWLVLMRAMREQANFIALDLPGWGDSERRDDAAYGFAEQARRVGEFLDALDLRNVVLVGHSMGGGIAAVTAASRPDRVGSRLGHFSATLYC